MHNLLRLCLGLSLFTACGPDLLYQEERLIPTEQWTYSDSLVYAFEIEDTLAIYNLYLDVQHQPDYPYQNMYIRIHTTFPGGERLQEVLNIDMAEPSGNWYGDCGRSGCSLRVNLQEGAYFNVAGPYRITIEQFMRQNPLPGLTSLTLALETTGNQRSQ